MTRKLLSTAAQLTEEQTLPLYRQKRYYPVKIGEVFNGRYRIITKLGYGAYSTVWLAKDERSMQYISLKVCAQETQGSPILNEVSTLRHLGKCAHQQPDSAGILFTRLAEDIFEVDNPFGGRHYCIASKPQEGSIRSLQEVFPDAILPKLLVRSLMHRLLLALNFLHADGGIVHTDVTPLNVLSEAEGDTIFEELEEQELNDPSVPVMIDDDLVYPTRFIQPELSGVPILTDFGQSRPMFPESTDWWMPDLYRAPEVLLKLPWGSPVDVWCVGVMTLELLEGRNLFDPLDRDNHQYVFPLALAQYIAYLGPPPLEMLKQSPLFSTYFDRDGNWISEPPIPKTSLEGFVTTIPPGEEKDLFLKFIRKILTWDSEARFTANELIRDEWLMRPTEEML